MINRKYRGLYNAKEYAYGLQKACTTTGVCECKSASGGKEVVRQNGYVYVFISNESRQDVLFDNLGVTQITEPVMEETHYYPFGLTMTGISTTAPLKIETKRKFNGIELIIKNLEMALGWIY